MLDTNLKINYFELSILPMGGLILLFSAKFKYKKERRTNRAPLE